MTSPIPLLALACAAVLAPTPAPAQQAAPPPAAAADGAEVRAVVSLAERRLWLLEGADTLLSTPVAVGKGTVLSEGGRTWDFTTPPGRRTVLRKEEEPVWVPPDWHYVELARERGFALVRLERGRGVPLADGSRVVVRGERIGRVRADGTFEAVPPDEEAVFGDTLFVPPFGTANRRIRGELGRFSLDLGDGYLLHGTPHAESIGRAATHGCIRVPDDALAVLYARLPVGAPVHVY